MKTKIDAAEVQSLLSKHPSLTLTPQSAFIRIDAPNGLRCYASKSAWVTRFDLSGFVYPSGPGITDIPEDQRPTGKVCQQVDFDQSKEVILETIEAVLEFMVAQAAKSPSKKPSKPAKEEPKGWGFEATTEEAQPQA